ncbi:MAG: YdcF family protein [Ketobacteraceae bacterium]|nr:YdcF family protein [Ketobacteraceae bacterium]
MTSLILPPALQILLVLLGLLLWRFKRGLAMVCFVLSFTSLVLLSMPQVSVWLYEPLERYPALTAEQVAELGAQGAGNTAIVVLGGGKFAAPEYNGETVATEPLGRLRYGAMLARSTGLPILVSGGDPHGTGDAEAELMAEVLSEFGIKRVLMERLSATTWENAKFSADILRRQSIHRVILVTQAWHMRRAVYSFEQFGFEVVAAPTLFRSAQPALLPYMPQHRPLFESAVAIREWLGLGVYSLFYEPPANLDYQNDQQAKPQHGPPAP